MQNIFRQRTSRLNTKRGQISVLVQVALSTSLLLYALSNASTVNESADSPRCHVVTIENMSFTPEVSVVCSGDRIEFRNKDIVPHTVTSMVPGIFDSGVMLSENEWQYSTDAKGTFQYKCALHPLMKGSIVVE